MTSKYMVTVIQKSLGSLSQETHFTMRFLLSIIERIPPVQELINNKFHSKEQKSNVFSKAWRGDFFLLIFSTYVTQTCTDSTNFITLLYTEEFQTNIINKFRN